MEKSPAIASKTKEIQRDFKQRRSGTVTRNRIKKKQRVREEKRISIIEFPIVDDSALTLCERKMQGLQDISFKSNNN